VIGDLVDAGMPCLEVYHSSHSEDVQQHYASLAQRYGLSATGGSDFHGEGTRRSEFFGLVGLPAPEFARLKALLAGTRRGTTATTS
jgi:hypothetical protein